MLFFHQGVTIIMLNFSTKKIKTITSSNNKKPTIRKIIKNKKIIYNILEFLDEM
jgi:hypothetical protein